MKSSTEPVLGMSFANFKLTMINGFIMLRASLLFCKNKILLKIISFSNGH